MKDTRPWYSTMELAIFGSRHGNYKLCVVKDHFQRRINCLPITEVKTENICIFRHVVCEIKAPIRTTANFNNSPTQF